jgi:hypothetical protein
VTSLSDAVSFDHIPVYSETVHALKVLPAAFRETTKRSLHGDKDMASTR